MKIAVWGAGAIGTALAYRLATTPFTAELFWINQTLKNIESRRVDIEHGLAFAPACRRVTAYQQRFAHKALEQCDLVILTLGKPVPKGGRREDLYSLNRGLFLQSVVPALKAHFRGVVLVVTNPVDLMARLIRDETGFPESRVIGLGTVVETARLRASLASHVSGTRPAREIWAYAIGTHDERFIPVAPRDLGLGTVMDESERSAIIRMARKEVARGARRVKADDRSTLHPVVEGTIVVAEAIALDSYAILTVSVHDPATADGLFYSVPCTLGKSGVIERHTDLLQDVHVAAELALGLKSLRATLRDSE